MDKAENGTSIKGKEKTRERTASKELEEHCSKRNLPSSNAQKALVAKDKVVVDAAIGKGLETDRRRTRRRCTPARSRSSRIFVCHVVIIGGGE